MNNVWFQFISFFTLVSALCCHARLRRCAEIPGMPRLRSSPISSSADQPLSWRNDAAYGDDNYCGWKEKKPAVGIPLGLPMKHNNLPVRCLRLKNREDKRNFVSLADALAWVRARNPGWGGAGPRCGIVLLVDPDIFAKCCNQVNAFSPLNTGCKINPIWAQNILYRIRN